MAKVGIGEIRIGREFASQDSLSQWAAVDAGQAELLADPKGFFVAIEKIQPLLNRATVFSLGKKPRAFGVIRAPPIEPDLPRFDQFFEDIADGALVPARKRTWCEFKGEASYFDVVAGGRVAADAAWHYPHPASGYEALTGHVAFYPGRMDACFVDDEQVRPQKGDFYGGWITAEIDGPFKGGPGTRGW